MNHLPKIAFHNMAQKPMNELFKLARVVLGNISKKCENMRSMINKNVCTRWFFNRTLSIYSHNFGK